MHLLLIISSSYYALARARDLLFTGPLSILIVRKHHNSLFMKPIKHHPLPMLSSRLLTLVTCHSRQGFRWSYLAFSLSRESPGTGLPESPQGGPLEARAQASNLLVPIFSWVSLVTSNHTRGVSVVVIMSLLSHIHPIKKQTPSRSWVMSSFILGAQSFFNPHALSSLSLPPHISESWHPNYS